MKMNPIFMWRKLKRIRTHRVQKSLHMKAGVANQYRLMSASNGRRICWFTIVSTPFFHSFFYFGHVLISFYSLQLPYRMPSEYLNFFCLLCSWFCHEGDKETKLAIDCEGVHCFPNLFQKLYFCWGYTQEPAVKLDNNFLVPVDVAKFEWPVYMVIARCCW
jgi:hypothetical protein